MKKIIISSIILFCLYQSATGQGTAGNARELKIGDTLPPTMLSGFIDQPGVSKDASAFYRKGLLIIDFWATWCIPCITELQKADSLLSKFPGRLAIVSATDDNKKTVLAFLKRHPEIGTAQVKIVTGNAKLSAYFPHRSLPHNVWIDSKGVVRAITYGQEINEQNIRQMLNGTGPALFAKEDDMQFDYEKPYHVADSVIYYRSIFSRYNPRISGGITVDRGLYADRSVLRRVFAWNGSITQLLWLGAFAKLPFQTFDENYKLIELHTTDSTKFLQKVFVHSPETIARYPSTLEWSLANEYCYELILPYPIPDTLACTYVMTDLLRNFPVKASIEPREREVLCITTNAGTSNWTKAAGKEKVFKLTEDGLNIRNMPISEILQKLNHYFPNLDPFINETGINYNIDLDLIGNIKGLNFDRVRHLMENAGFVFTNSKRKVNVLVIRDSLDRTH